MKTINIESPVPGTVVLIHCQDGNLVHEGEIAVTIEMMKTHIPVYAPATGVIQYLIREGEGVVKEDVLAQIHLPE